MSSSVRPPDVPLPELFPLDATGHSAAFLINHDIDEAEESSGGGPKLWPFVSDWLWGSLGDSGCGFWSVARWVWH